MISRKNRTRNLLVARLGTVCLISCTLHCLAPAQAPRPVASDPTTPTADMAEVLRALKAAEDAPTETGRANQMELPDVNLTAWVAGGGKAAAVLRIGDNFYPIRTGESIALEDWQLVATEVSDRRIALRQAGAAEESVLGVRRGESGGGAELDIVQLNGVPLYLATRAFSDVTGIQVATSAEARDLPVTLYLRSVGAAETLESLVLTHGLFASEPPHGGIARLYTSKEYSRDAATLRDETTKVFTLRYPNSRDVALSIRDLFGARVRLSSRIEEEDEPGEFLTEDLQQRLERFDAIDARGQGFGTGNGSGATTASFRSNSSRFRNLSENSRLQGNRRFNRQQNDDERDSLRLEDLPPEDIVALESGDQAALDRILQARADIFVTAIDRLNKIVVRTRDEKTMAAITELVLSLDVPTPLVFIEVKILEVELGKGLDSAFDWSFQDDQFGGSFQPGGPALGGDLVFTYLDDSFEAQMRLLQSRDKVTMLSRPTLMTANNEVSRLFIGEEVPLNRDFAGGQTIVTDGGPIVTPSTTGVEFRPVGSTLLITPNINEDRTVTLRVLQEESRVVQDGADILVPTDGGGFDNRSIDTVASQTASGTFVALDGQTIAIGGLISEQITSRRSQIPILGDIPILGLLARNQRQSRSRTEIVLLVTPHVISTPSEGGAVTEQFMRENSLHPLAPTAGDGTLGTFRPDQILTPGSEDFGVLFPEDSPPPAAGVAPPVKVSPPPPKPEKSSLLKRIFKRRGSN